MHRPSAPLALAVVLAALVLAGSAGAKDAQSDHAAPGAAELVRQAGEAARRGDEAHPATEAGMAADAHEADGAPADGADGEPHTAAGSVNADGHAADHGSTDPADDGHQTPDDARHDGKAASHDAADANHGDAEAAHGDGEGEHGDAENGETAEHHEPPPTRGPQPYEVIRSLQFLQDQAARGNASANRVQARLLQWYGPAFERAGQETWKEPRNQRAAALFVLSGGPPSVLRAILARNDFPPEVKPLLDGALAYVENRQADAERLLGGLDLKTMEPGLAAQINLAVAQMVEKTAPEKALARLRQVMLDASGTLLEEAALRLGMGLADQLGQSDQADVYARLYFDRYAKSIYAGNFRALFTAMYVARPFDQAANTMHLIDDAVARIPLEDQINIFLSVGRRALIAGNMKLASITAERVLAVPNIGKPASQRALLYVAASTLTLRDMGETMAMLQSIDRAGLHPADRKLYDAVAGVLGEIRKPLLAGAAPDPKDVKDSVTEASLDTSVVDRATRLLDAVRNDLESMDP